MADFTLSDIFGASATFDETEKTLTFDLDDFAGDSFDLSAINATNIDDYSSKIFWAILSNILVVQPESNNEEDRGIYVTNQGKRTAVRNGVSQFAFQLIVSGYTPDSLGVELAPNDMVGGNQGG